MNTAETLSDRWLQAAVSRFETALTHYAARLVGGERAKDVVQDTFVSLCGQRREDVEARLGAWLFTVCRNRALDVLRKEQRLVPLDRDRAAPGLAEVRVEARQALAVLGTLPADQQRVIRLKLQSGLSYKEIAAATGLSVSNVGYLIHVGLKSLRAKMGARHA